MKKSLFKMVLSLCLIAAMLLAFSAAAFADGNTISYTLKKGDTVAGVCKSMGIDFDKYQNWITTYNNIRNYAALPVGYVVVLPANNSIPISSLPVRAGTATPTTPAATPVTSPTSNPYIQAYTLKSGDYLTKICVNLGIDFAKYSAWIGSYNNITNYNNMKVGQVIYLPKNNDVKLSDLPGGTAVPTTAAATTAAAVVGTGAVAYSGDYIHSYLINYTVRSGETIYSICRALGISFEANVNKIMSMNNISNAKSLRVGQTIVIPSSVAPASGSYTTVIAHRVVKGDTTVAICNAYGVNYGKNVDKIKALNNNMNLAKIQVGQILYIPVAGTVTAAGGGAGGTVVPSGGATPAASSAAHAIYADGDGTYVLSVNNTVVKGSAPEGSTVKLTVTPNKYRNVKAVVVIKRGDPSVMIALTQISATEFTFIMPKFDITVGVYYEEIPTYAIIVPTSIPAGVNVTVNGVAGTTAVKGDTIRVTVTPNTGYQVTKISYKNITTSAVVEITGGTFTMPDSGVELIIETKPA